MQFKAKYVLDVIKAGIAENAHKKYSSQLTMIACRFLCHHVIFSQLIYIQMFLHF